MEENLQTPIEAVQPAEKDQLVLQQKSNNYLLVIFSLLLLIMLSLTAFLYYQNQQLKSMLAAYQTPAPLATADPTANWKTYTKDNYQIKYPSDWSVSTISHGFAVIQGKYQINILTSNPGFGPGICIFSDSPNFNNSYTDNPILAGSKCPGDYTQINGTQFTFRRKNIPVTSPEGVQTGHWTIYVKDSESNFVTNPPIDYQEPVNVYDISTIKLMDQILSTLKFISPTNLPTPTLKSKVPTPLSSPTPTSNNILLPAPTYSQPTPHTITITSPNGGETLTNQHYNTITWNSTGGYFNQFDLYYFDCPSCSANYFGSTNGITHSYSWYTNLVNTTFPHQEKIRIVGHRSDTGEDNPSDESDGYFTVVQ